jgi:hypothetical protein
MARELRVEPLDGTRPFFQARSFNKGGELWSASQMDSTSVKRAKRINLPRAWVQIDTLRFRQERMYLVVSSGNNVTQ